MATTAELDQTMSFGNSKNSMEFEKDAVLEDGWYRCVLSEIGKPFVKTNPLSGKDITKAAFVFRVIGEKGKGNTVVETTEVGSRLTAFINIEGWGDRATMFMLCQAVLENKADEVKKAKGQVLPSDILNKELWVRVSTTYNPDKDEYKTWAQEFKHELPNLAALKPATKAPLKTVAATAETVEPEGIPF